MKQYERQIFRTALHITQNREDAEDITQDVFVKAFTKLDQFQGNSKFSTWLVRIAVNESLMRLRKRKTSKTVSMDQDVETEDGSIPRDFAEWRPNPVSYTHLVRLCRGGGSIPDGGWNAGCLSGHGSLLCQKNATNF